MHEAGLARAIVAALGGGDVSGRRMRVLLRGGHPDGDAALRMHLAAMAPEICAVEVVRMPTTRTCSRCGAAFESADAVVACGTCGGAAWPLPTTEAIELELIPEDEERRDVPGTTEPRVAG